MIRRASLDRPARLLARRAPRRRRPRSSRRRWLPRCRAGRRRRRCPPAGGRISLALGLARGKINSPAGCWQFAVGSHHGPDRQAARPRISRLVRSPGGQARVVPQCIDEPDHEQDPGAHRCGCDELRRAAGACQFDLALQLAKDPYVFDFLNLTSDVAERELEQALMDRIVETLRELARVLRSWAARCISVSVATPST